MKKLNNKNVLLIVSGSIAAYKSPDIIRRLQEYGAIVKVIITKSGLEFITELSLKTISNNEVITDKKYQNNPQMPHIELANWADVVLVAPASANIISQIAQGNANNLATNALLATSANIVIAPAMNKKMLANQATQDNITRLKNRNINVINCAYGEQACGDIGDGRLADTNTIVAQVIKVFTNQILLGKKVLITAGATVEYIDPVRFISNNSSGKMAYALANACVEAGAEVLFIYAEMQINPPDKVKLIKATTADNMYQMVMKNITKQDIFISVAGVTDYKIAKQSKVKIPKQQKLNLELVASKDILADVCKLDNKPFTVGFAAQTDNLLVKAYKKYQQKKCDLLIANDVSKKGIGFNSDDNEVYILHNDDNYKLSKQSKTKIAIKIIDFISQVMAL